MQNATIEERIALLEIQVIEIEEDVSYLDQEIQDDIVSKFRKVPDSIKNCKTFFSLFLSQFFLMTDLQANNLDLDVRVGNLEENSMNDGNSSIAELELRVGTLEDVTAELEIQVNSLEDVTADQETRIVVAEENIQGEKLKLCNCQEI